jgi:hypothetical protein
MAVVHAAGFSCWETCLCFAAERSLADVCAMRADGAADTGLTMRIDMLVHTHRISHPGAIGRGPTDSPHRR